MTTLALTLSLALAAPSGGVVLAEQIGKSSTPVSSWLDPLQADLGTRLTLKRLGAECAGKRECVLDAGRTAGLVYVVAVTLAHGKRQTLDLEAIRVRDGVTLAQLTFTLAGKFTDAEHTRVREFAVRVADLVAPEEKATDVPVREPDRVAAVEPREVPDAGVQLTTSLPPPRKSAVPAVALLGGGAAAGVASGVLLGLALDKRATLDNTPNPSPLTRPEANELAARANGEFTGALVTGLAAGALVTAAVIWLVTD
jgi:hypothetical protein